MPDYTNLLMVITMRRALVALCFVLAVLACLAGLAGRQPAQQPQGEAELAFALDRLPVTVTVLHTGAHPDDEDTALLAYLVRGRGARAAYLSATRGEGGQNLLGPEQYQALGLLRTEELLAARRLDGADQFFTRAFDFGFSKEGEEALRKWGHERTLSDFVRVIRTYQPDIILSRFRGGPQDGHGQHQAAGILSREAFRAAADANRFPEQIQEGLKPWQASKFYIEINRFGPSANQPPPEGSVGVELGDYNAWLGRSYIELAMEGRSLHRSQAMGVPQRKGPYKQYFLLTETAKGGDISEARKNEHDIFDGVQARIPETTHGALLQQIALARRAFDSRDTPALIAALAHGLEMARQLPDPLRSRKEAEFEHALALAYGLAVDALVDREELVPGEQARVNVTTWNRANAPLEVRSIELRAPAGWQQQMSDAFRPTTLAYNTSAHRAFLLTPPADVPVSQPYWLIKPLEGQSKSETRWRMPPRDGDSYEVEDPHLIGLPENPPLMGARLRLVADGVEFRLDQPVKFRKIDPIYGQRDSEPVVVPRLAEWVQPRVLVFPPGTTHEVSVRERNNTSERILPGSESHFYFEANKQQQRPQIDFTSVASSIQGGPPGSSASGRIPPGGEISMIGRIGPVPPGWNVAAFRGFSAVRSVGPQVVSYPHIRPQYWFRPAEAHLVPVDLKIANNVRVGYVMGAGDEVPESLRQLGVLVQLLNADDLASANLGAFNAIVTGIRAYATRADLVEYNARLLEYVKDGGVLIVQYNSDWPGHRGGEGAFPFGPYAMAQKGRSPRVCMEEQPVKILAPDDPLLNTPNKITEADFDGWVQERGLYFMNEWSPEYRPLFESHDPNEPEQKGGMLVARYGKGLYMYTAYSWFRELPEGVPGAYRIWANLLSVGKRLNSSAETLRTRRRTETNEPQRTQRSQRH